MACAGNTAEQCGGPGRLTMFSQTGTQPAPPAVNPGPPGWVSLGCYS
jgi:hypothetical protein